jgi:AcrR family transcriptional regulator
MFLNAAATLFAQNGFEAATMTKIAERSGASIGTLYHYFPDKQSVASALLNRYTRQIARVWKPLMERTETLTHEEFADLFIERTTEFFRRRPAYFKLLAAPFRFSRDPAVKRALRIAFADAFRAKNPNLSNEQALLAANVTLQMVKGMINLYAEAGAKEKALVTAEFKKILAMYLATVLSNEATPAKSVKGRN